MKSLFTHPYPYFLILHPKGTPSFPPVQFETALRKRTQLWHWRRDLVERDASLHPGETWAKCAPTAAQQLPARRPVIAGGVAHRLVGIEREEKKPAANRSRAGQTRGARLRLSQWLRSAMNPPTVCFCQPIWSQSPPAWLRSCAAAGRSPARSCGLPAGPTHSVAPNR